MTKVGIASRHQLLNSGTPLSCATRHPADITHAPPAAMTEDQTPPLYFMNDIRALIIIAVVLFHTAIGFMQNAPAWWYAISPRQTKLADIFVVLSDAVIMPPLFFIAGYFAGGSLKRYGPANFLKNRMARLGIPWLCGALAVAPGLAYSTAKNLGYADGLAEFLKHAFWGVYFSQGPYWFLSLLLAFCGAAAALARIKFTVLPDRAVLALVYLAGVAGMFAACLFRPPDSWFNAGWLLVFQPARVLGYAAYFMLGFHALGKTWFAKNRPAPRKRNWLAATVVSGFIWLAVKAAFPSPQNSWQCLLYAVGQNTFCLTFVMSLFNWGAARNKLQKAPLLPALAKSSFSIYLWHLPVIILLAPAVFAAELPAALQFLLLAVAGIGIPAGLAKAAGK